MIMIQYRGKWIHKLMREVGHRALTLSLMHCQWITCPHLSWILGSSDKLDTLQCVKIWLRVYSIGISHHRQQRECTNSSQANVAKIFSICRHLSWGGVADLHIVYIYKKKVRQSKCTVSSLPSYGLVEFDTIFPETADMILFMSNTAAPMSTWQLRCTTWLIQGVAFSGVANLLPISSCTKKIIINTQFCCSLSHGTHFGRTADWQKRHCFPSRRNFSSSHVRFSW